MSSPRPVVARTYKYQAQMGPLASCPPSTAKEGDRSCFRFVGSPLKASHFLPIPLEDPDRSLSGEQSCAGWGLSLFDTDAAARKRYAELTKRHKTLKKKWTHLAKLDLTPDHGAHTASNSIGHFTLFEYANADLTTCATTVGTL